MSDELTGGEWVTRGGIKVWTGPRPVDEPEELRGVDLSMHLGVESLMATLARNFDRIKPIGPRVTGVTCHCGCLLRDANESCPACLVWATADAARASWAADINYYRPTRMESAA